MAEFGAVVQQLAKNNDEERQRDSNMNQNIAFQGESTRKAIEGMIQSITDGLANTTDSLVDSAEATTTAITGSKKNESGEVERQNRMMRMFESIRGGIGSLVDSVKDKAKAVGGKVKDLFKNMLIGGAILAVLAFLNSPYWEQTKTLIKDQVIPAIRWLYENAITPFFEAISGISTSFTTMLADPSWENISAFFGDAGTIALGLGALLVLLNPFKTLGLVTSAIGKSIGLLKFAFSKDGGLATGLAKQANRLKGGKMLAGLRGGLGKLVGGFNAIGTQMTDMLTGTKKDASGVVRKTGKGVAGQFAGGAARGAGAIAKGALRFAGPVGLVATAAFGVFDAVKSGLDEAKNENATAGSIVKASVSGLLSGLTFGLVEQQTISDGITSIGTGITNAFDTAKTSLVSGFNTVKAGVTSVMEDPEGAFNKVTSKINELTGLSIPDFATTKEQITAFGESLKTKAADLAGKFEEFTGINIPTFSEAKNSLTQIGTDLMSKFDGLMDNVDLEGAKGVLSGLGDSLSSAFSSLTEGVTGLFSDDRTEKEKLEQRMIDLQRQIDGSSVGASIAAGFSTEDEKEELAKLREEYAALISAQRSGGGTTIINNNMAAVGGGSGGGTTTIMPEPLSDTAHPLSRRGRNRTR